MNWKELNIAYKKKHPNAKGNKYYEVEVIVLESHIVVGINRGIDNDWLYVLSPPNALLQVLGFDFKWRVDKAIKRATEIANKLNHKIKQVVESEWNINLSL